MSKRLDHRVTIRRLAAVRGDYNQPLEQYTDFYVCSAERHDLFVTEQLRAREVGAQITARFTVRYSSETASITAADRLKLEDGLEYNIVGVREAERNRWLEISVVGRDGRES